MIRLARPPDELARRPLLARVAARPGVGAARARTTSELWFGHDPSDPGFGGRTFPSGRHGHTGYWDPATRPWTGWPGSCSADDPRDAGRGRRPTARRVDAGRRGTGGLLDGDRLGQVARLVDVVAPGGGDLAGEHLQRHGGHQRREQGRRARHADQVVGVRARPPRRPPRRSRWCGRRGPGPPGCWRRSCRAATPRPRGDGTTQTTGVPSSISAIGPCLSSPAAKPSACM